jgi:hypothetical protein
MYEFFPDSKLFKINIYFSTISVKIFKEIFSFMQIMAIFYI